VFEAQDGIIGKADLMRFPLEPGLHLIFEPSVEDVVQV
jgi:hypothetical protein